MDILFTTQISPEKMIAKKKKAEKNNKNHIFRWNILLEEVKLDK